MFYCQELGQIGSNDDGDCQGLLSGPNFVANRGCAAERYSEGMLSTKLVNDLNSKKGTETSQARCRCADNGE